MKTMYQKPNTEVIFVTVQQMIAASKELVDGFKMDEAPTTNETSGNLSRNFNPWGDDEEEF